MLVQGMLHAAALHLLYNLLKINRREPGLKPDNLLYHRPHHTS